MVNEISFKDNISALEKALNTAREELAELEQRAQLYDHKTQETRQALDNLRRTLRGELPTDSERRAGASIRRLPINEDTGRPARGARRSQIETICRKLGRGQNTFRTVDVLNTLREVERELTDGMKSYTYAVMTTLEKEDILEKVGRGTWQLKR